MPATCCADCQIRCTMTITFTVRLCEDLVKVTDLDRGPFVMTRFGDRSR